jgi:hypothetical protein
MKNPKRLNSRFPGTCNDCGAHVETGAPILWLRKNTIVCADCDAAGYDDAGRPIGTPATATDSTPAGNWAAALAWNDATPTPGDSIGTRGATTPANNPHAASNRLIADAIKSGRVAAPVITPADSTPTDSTPATDRAPELPAARILKTVQSDRPELTPAAATLVDMLVTIVNAIDRLTVDDCEAVAAHCLHFANETASGSRRRAFQSLARTIH